MARTQEEEEDEATPVGVQVVSTLLDMTGRPRRSNPDTIQYLRQLPLISSDTNDVTTVNDDDKTELSFIMLQGLYEIKSELASIAGTEIGSAILEGMIKLLLPQSNTVMTLLWHGLSPYIHHLALHRYGSHVLQTLMDETTRSIFTSCTHSKIDIAQLDDAPELPAEPMGFIKVNADWIIALAKSIDAETLQQWMTNICASHVLRSLIATLCGRCYNTTTASSSSSSMEEMISNNSSNKKKKKKKRKRQGADDEYMAVLPIGAAVPHGFGEALQRIQDLLWENYDEKWPFDPSACPVLCLVVQNAPYPRNDVPEDWMYHATASRFWQASVESAASDSVVVQNIANAHAKSVSQYIQNDTANFCVQTMLEKHGVWVDECLDQLPYIMEVANHRRGVLWKLTKACRELENPKSKIVRAIESYGIRKFSTEGAPSLAVLAELLPSIEHLLKPLVHDLSRNSLASKILVEPWIEHAQSNFPIVGQVSDLARHPVGQHVVAKYVLVTRTVPNELLELRHANHPIAKRLFHERLQLPLYEEKGARAWNEALGITGGTNKKRRKEGDEMK